jgi:hypothetical protein
MPVKKKSIINTQSIPAVNQPQRLVIAEPPVGIKHESMKKGTSLFKS